MNERRRPRASSGELTARERVVARVEEEYVERFAPGRCATVPATDIAREHLGRPLPNAALLGAFAALTGEVSLDSVSAAIRERFSGATGEQNVAAAEEAHRSIVRVALEVPGA